MTDLELTNDPEKMTELYVEAFNSGDPDLVNRLYTDEAVSVWEPGKVVTGDDRRKQLAEALSQGPVMAATLRHAYVTGDTAMLVVDWKVDMANPEGVVEHHSGVGLDVIVRVADGTWRFAIDNPYEQAN